jgi:hypothetical protein
MSPVEIEALCLPECVLNLPEGRAGLEIVGTESDARVKQRILCAGRRRDEST